MSLRLYSALIGFSLLAACKTAPDKEACALPKGRFVNQTVLSACPGKMPVDVPHYALDIEFKGIDSAIIDNGFERVPLKVNAAGGCVFKIASATQFGDMELRITSDSTFELIDSAWTNVASASVFTKVMNGEKAEWSFQEFLNECAVTGEYALFHNGDLIPGVITLLPNGQMNGMKPFIGYRLCYAGDCLETTDPPSRTIELIDNQGNIQTFSVKPLEGKMALELYSIGDPIPDIKGSRPIGPMVYELRTE
jgi:hypothetical protein